MFEKTLLDEAKSSLALNLENKNRLDEKRAGFEAKMDDLDSEEKACFVKKERITSTVDKTQEEISEIENMLQNSTKQKSAFAIQEQELNEKLNEVQNLLSEFRTDKRVSEKEARIKEAIASMKR